MKTYDELTPIQCARAKDIRLHQLIELVKQYPDALGHRLELCVIGAWKEVEQTSSPWFFSEFLLDDAEARAILKETAEYDVCEAYFSESEELVIKL